MSTNTVNNSGTAASMGLSYTLFESSIAPSTNVNAHYILLAGYSCRKNSWKL